MQLESKLINKILTIIPVENEDVTISLRDVNAIFHVPEMDTPVTVLQFTTWNLTYINLLNNCHLVISTNNSI